MNHDPMLAWIKRHYGEDVARATEVCDQLQSNWLSDVVENFGQEPSAENLHSCIECIADQLNDQFTNMPTEARYFTGRSDRVLAHLKLLGIALADLARYEDENEDDDENIEEIAIELADLPRTWNMPAHDGLLVKFTIRTYDELAELTKLLSADQVTTGLVLKWLGANKSEAIATSLQSRGIEAVIGPDMAEAIRGFFRWGKSE